MEIILDGRLKTESAVLALGMFDGVHLGHQVLLQKGRSLADAARVPLVACTFVKHPLELIAPDKAPALLTTFEEKARLMEKAGVDHLFAQPFDSAMMNQLPECYVGELVRRLHPTDVVCGYNHRFGKNGAGSPALLEVLGGALGFRTAVVPKITYQGQDVSSSVIRELLAAGQVGLARRMLGRPYHRQGTVAWRENGRTGLVMPPNGKQTLPPGRYRVLAEAGEKTFPAVLTICERGTGNIDLAADMPIRSAIGVEFVTEM